MRRIFDLYLVHKSTFRVAEEMNRLGFSRKTYRTKDGRILGGKPFDPDTVIRILSRKVYIGIITNERTRQEFSGQQHPIVSPEVFEAAQGLLASHNKREGEVLHGANKHGFLLKGLVRCGECKSAVVGYVQSKKKKTYRYYKCQSNANGLPIHCRFKTIGAQKLEEYLIEKLSAVGWNHPLLERVVEKANRDLVMVKQAFYMILLLSFGCPVVLMMIQPDYLKNAFADGVGRILIQIGMIMNLTAIVIFKKIISVKM